MPNSCHPGSGEMFDLQRFIADCRAALAEGTSHRAVREVVARAVCDPGAVLKALGEPKRAGIEALYHASDLTILNILWRRIDAEPGAAKVEAAGARAICAKDAEPLGRDIIHSVTNPLPRLTGALQV